VSAQKNLLRQVAVALSVGDIDHVAEWFTEDFQLHDPGIGGYRYGHQGAQEMLQALMELIPGAKIEALDMVEEGDRVAVRWLCSGMKEGQPFYLSIVAIYRFVDSRIAEDWGIGARANWP
jgi:predicted ester cyclase